MLSRITLIALLAFMIPFRVNSQSARQYYRTGLTFAEAGNLQDAITQFTRAIDLDPEYVQAYIERSNSLEIIGELQLAADDLNRAITFESKQAELYINAARLNFLLTRYDPAIAFINKGISLDKKSESAFRILARIQMAQEEYSDALASITKALELKDNAENFFYRGQLSEKMKNYKQSETDYTTAILKNPKYVESLIALAHLRILLNKPKEAMVSCDAILKDEPAHREALLVRSRAYAILKEYPHAIDDLSKILSGNPDDKEMYQVRGIYYQEFTQHQQAINDFSKVLLLDPRYSEAIYRRASSFEQIGDFKAAIKDYETLTTLSSEDLNARQLLDSARQRLFELNRESDPPGVALAEPPVSEDSILRIASNKSIVVFRGKLTDVSEIKQVLINKKPAAFYRSGSNFEFTGEVDISLNDLITLQVRDVYENITTAIYSVVRTEIDPPYVSVLTPYASDNGEIYLDTDNTSLFVEGIIHDESNIRSIMIDGVTASFTLDELNPRFSATINVANKNKFTVTASDNYGNETTAAFVLNREGVSMLESNPMGRTWVVFIENSNYETFPSLDGPVRDVTLMRSALVEYDIHKIIHKQDMSKKEMERFFSIELRDLLRSNKVNSLMIWYAGHGNFYNETGYWIPVDAKREDEFTYYNLNALRASLQSFAGYITHNLVISDACESGPAFSQAMREMPKERNCNDWEAVKFKSSQVFTSAGYELAVDNSQFTKTFAHTLANNPNACLPIEAIVNKVMPAVLQTNRQEPKFGKITGMEDEDGTFFFMSGK